MIRYLRSLTGFKKARISTISIMFIAAYVSYFNEHDLLVLWKLPLVSQVLIPVTVDILAITCNIALHMAGVRRRGFWTSLIVLIIAVGVSGSANWIEGGTLGAKCSNLWTVAAYLLSEFVTASLRDSDSVQQPKQEDTSEKTESRRSSSNQARIARLREVSQVDKTSDAVDGNYEVVRS